MGARTVIWTPLGILFAGAAGSLFSCTLTSLEGLSSPSHVTPDGGALAADAQSSEDAANPVVPGRDASSDSGNLGSTCVNGVDAICAAFDDGPLEKGWVIQSPTGSYAAGSGRSPPNAVAFGLPNSGNASSGPRFVRTFEGGWSRVDCSFAAALDEIPADGVVDIATATSEMPTVDDVGLRVGAGAFRLISCRDGSDCRAEVEAGPLPSLRDFHDYRLEWLADGTYRFYLDGSLRASITTKTPLAKQSLVSVAFGLIYRPYGNGGTFQVRHDDIACTRTP